MSDTTHNPMPRRPQSASLPEVAIIAIESASAVGIGFAVTSLLTTTRFFSHIGFEGDNFLLSAAVGAVTGTAVVMAGERYLERRAARKFDENSLR